MDRKEFKNIFGENAKANGFASAYGGWYKQSEECIVVLELQKSNYGDYYILNVKTFVQGSFGITYKANKELIKSPMGDVAMVQSPTLRSIFDLDTPIEDRKRINEIKILFKDYIIPFTEKTLSKKGIMDLVENGELRLLSSVRQELEKLMK